MKSPAFVPQQGNKREHRLCLSLGGNLSGNESTSGRRRLVIWSAILPVSSSRNQTKSNYPQNTSTRRAPELGSLRKANDLTRVGSIKRRGKGTSSAARL